MPAERTFFPKSYSSKMDIMRTEIAIKLTKDTFERELANNLRLIRVSAPLTVRPETGLNDNLNGIERPVAFDVPAIGGKDVQIVQSLAKWKRLALYRYGFTVGTGLYTDMNAIRRDEETDNIHSIYVDQWDWEMVISAEKRRLDFLKETVEAIMDALRSTEKKLLEAFPELSKKIPDEIYFITTPELEKRYPALSRKEREDAIAKEKKAVFLMQVGVTLEDGQPHDGRAPDYDDWTLNGDIILWNPILERAFEISSMGIRVDPSAMDSQLTAANCNDRRKLPFHSMVLDGTLPLSMGGGIGQSRICMFFLEKAHIGEVQASIWPDDVWDICRECGVNLL